MITKLVDYLILLAFLAPVAMSIGVWVFAGVILTAVLLAYAIGMIVTGEFLGPIRLLLD